MSDSRDKRPAAPPATRRRVDAAAQEEAVATVLRNTYAAEFVRHENLRRSPEDAADPGVRFARDFGEFREQKRRKLDRTAETVVDDETLSGGRLRNAAARQDPGAWLGVARVVIKLRADPATFIRRQFIGLTPGAASPAPNALLGQGAIANYRDGPAVAAGEIATAFRFQQEKFKTLAVFRSSAASRPTSEECWAYVLGDTDAELSPLFRHCLAADVARRPRTARPEAFATIADRFRLVAALQYVAAADAYDKVWREFIPAGFRDEAEALYLSFHGVDAGVAGEF